VTLFARWASVRTSAHIYAATRHVVGEAQSLTIPKALTRHPTGRGYHWRVDPPMVRVSRAPPGNAAYNRQVNFVELRQREVRRIPLPRTPVNKPRRAASRKDLIILAQQIHLYVSWRFVLLVAH
jgi:hypothetical protein